MCTSNDFLLQLTSAIVYKSNQYCNFLEQGVDDCCLKRQVQILTKYFDVISDYFRGRSCLPSSSILAMIKNCNTLVNGGLCYPDLVILPDGGYIIVPTPIPALALLPAGRCTLLANVIKNISYNRPLTTLDYIVLGNATALDGSGAQPYIIVDGSMNFYGFKAYTIVDCEFSWGVRLIA